MNQFGAVTGPESGQTMAEYAVTLGVITLAVVATLGLLTAGVTATMSSVIALL
jgi:Flp pilus assembly pilin Flp